MLQEALQVSRKRAGRVPAVAPVADGKSLKGLRVVLTGALASMTRSEAGRALRAAGAIVEDRVTRSTSLLVMGERPGSKLDVALALGTPIWGEAELQTALASAALAGRVGDAMVDLDGRPGEVVAGGVIAWADGAVEACAMAGGVA